MASYKKMLFFSALVFCFAMTNARTMLPSQTMAEVSQPTEEIILPVETVKSSQFCQLCEQYASEAIDYLSRSETQTEIFSALYHVCSKLDYIKQQCITMVDYYVPLLFEEVEDISPDDFCDRFKLCKGDSRQRLSLVEGDNYKPTKLENMLMKSKKSSQWCKICEKFATDALSYLEKNQTQTEIIAFLHQDCAKLDNFEEECVVLVDYYSPLLFSEIKKISPENFCENIHFCISEEVSVATRFHEKIEQFNDDTCSICEECKRLVLTYGPLFLARLEKFLETQDVCTRIHACKSSMQRFSGNVVIDSA
ncbi:proactivator polypeptide-like 1 isoform X2 [Carex littledalei]|uniref:Proactivator polypeptide-like 1 isoform X2 n=1 Tax=Carex littledalei TaxID=544730 RepID=A0A833QV43_9POAL|nr:proactivator polypeptide-like 1 isoform X2 [Carex littledalei]